mmetsp:Transcript_38305/g.97946  ORF Transcript_38305/g.97946 Transcript_38305/m.97946 type:complete len:678 (-) Transcript_38305:46-2079(-)
MSSAGESRYSLKAPLSSNFLDQHFEADRVRRLKLSWQHLTYTVTTGGSCGRKKTEKVVLRDVSGAVNPGQLMAVMGPTGCGKSSLLNALAGRLPNSGTLEGDILVNGMPRTSQFHTLTAYCLQDDALFANLTVRETFMVAAELRLPSKTPRTEKEACVDAVIAAMGLSKAAGTYIGNNQKRGVSGGERKRASIAVELISNPSLLFLDEPTSGLDSFQAQSVMEALLNLAKGGRTIVSVIHQPRSSIYQMCDQLCLLSEGQVMFMGPATEAKGYFAEAGHQCPDQFNVADFFLDLVSMDYRTPEAENETRARISTLASAHHKQPNIPDAQAEVPSQAQDEAETRNLTYSATFLRQFLVLFWRSVKQNMRNTVPNNIAMVQAIVMAVLLGLIYSDLQKTQMGIQDRLGVFFFITINSCMGALFAVMQTFPAEKVIINRERDARAYRTSMYFLAKVVSEIPFKMLPLILNGTILYWMIGLNPSVESFFTFLLVQTLLTFAASSIGLLVGSWTPTQEATFALAPMIMIVLMLFGGFYISLDSLPPGSAWVAYLSPMNWGFMALCLNDLKGQAGWECNVQCVPEGMMVPGASPANSNTYDTSCAAGEMLVVLPGCIQTGEEILTLRLGYTDGTTKWDALLYLLLGALGFLFIGYLGLRVTKQRYQPLKCSSTMALNKVAVAR